MSEREDEVTTPPAVIDRTVASEMASLAITATLALWAPQRRSFWRSTEQRGREQDAQDDAFYPTVSYSSLIALVRANGLPNWMTPTQSIQLWGQCVPAILSRDDKDVHSTLDSTVAPLAGVNPFTRAAITEALAVVVSDGRLPLDRQEVLQRLAEEARTLASSGSIDNLLAAGSAASHPFVLYRIIRTGRLALNTLPDDHSLRSGWLAANGQMLRHCRNLAILLLARHQLNALAPADSVAILFCGAALALSGDPSDHEFVLPCLRLAVQAQDESGSWPLGRVVAADKDLLASGKLEISTYEVALAVAETVLALLRRQPMRHDVARFDTVFVALMKALQHVGRSRVSVDGVDPPTRGWCGDHPYGHPMIESWTSAAVVQLCATLDQLAQEVDRLRTLRTFVFIDSVELPAWMDWTQYARKAEPEEDARILSYLERTIVAPIRLASRVIPDGSVSVLLFGPPGTSKTTIVKAIARALDWPVVSLSPGDFINQGLEFIEAQARNVFARLHTLTRAVILFDECDELFRDRRPRPDMEQLRSITAFVTASMLPKLQELHDARSVVFCICTNNFDAMDPAVKRGGRIDHIVGVGPPDAAARRRILADVAQRERYAFVQQLVDSLAAETHLFTRPELERAAAELWRRLSNSASKRRGIVLARDVAQALRPSLVITGQMYDDFQRSARQYSHPHLALGTNEVQSEES